MSLSAIESNICNLFRKNLFSKIGDVVRDAHVEEEGVDTQDVDVEEDADWQGVEKDEETAEEHSVDEEEEKAGLGGVGSKMLLDQIENQLFPSSSFSS